MARLLSLHKGSNVRPAIVFVHGLGGDPIETWRHANAASADCWPHWVGKDVDSDVWAVEYDAALSGWSDQAMPLPAQGDQIGDLLASAGGLKDRDLVLVGHSMGGVVIKTLLINGRTKGDQRVEDLVTRVKGVVFIATPHTGSQLANLARAMRWVLRTNEQVGNLQLHDPHLNNLNQQFRGAVVDMGLGARVFAERRKVSMRFGIGRISVPLNACFVVDPMSGDPGLPGVTAVPMAGDHFSVCKPADRTEQIHGSMCDFIRSFPDRSSQRAVRPVLIAPVVEDDLSRLSPPTIGAAAGGAPGRLTGAGDNRLQPREGFLYGRAAEVGRVLNFLRSAEVSTQVAGGPGNGKTEVCKGALKAWLSETPKAVAYYVDVPDRASPAELVDRIGRALGTEGIDTSEQLLAHLSPGLYYLDNLESVVEQAEGREMLRALKAKPGIRLLVSSRVALPGVMGTPIPVDALPAEDALRLFRELWAGTDALPPDVELARFVGEQLGHHAFSVTLVARLGDCYSYEELVQRWTLTGASSAHDPLDASRLGSLPISLHLTADALARREGTLALWTVAALFATGMSEDVLRQLEVSGGWSEARQWLVRHHLLVRRNERWHLLPPIARYALDASLSCEAGFDWLACRGAIQSVFGTVAKEADSVASTSGSLAARRWLLENFGTWSRIVQHDLACSEPDLDWLQAMNSCLLNVYQFRAILARDVLRLLSSRLSRPASAMLVLGNMEGRLGRPDEARKLYDRALVLYEGEQDGLGQANTLQSLGDLEGRLGRPDEARKLYDRALVLFEGEQAGLGQANTLKALGDLEGRLGRPDEARKLYDRALVLFEGEQAGLGQANTLQSLGDVEGRLGRPDEARKLYDRALVLYEGEQDGLGQANTLKSLGDLERRLGRPDEARKLYDRALVLYEGEQDGLGQANTLRSLGDLEGRLGRPDEARKLYDRALVLYEGEQDGLGQANTLKSLGDLERRLGRPDEARKLYDRALVLYEGEQDGLGQANTLRSLGDLERRLGRPDEARKLYDRALVLYEGEQDGLGQANTLQSLGDLEGRLGRPDEARKLYDRALVLFEGEQAGLGQANTLRSLGDLEGRLGRPDEARKLYDRALVLYEGEQDGLGQANTLQSLGDLERRLGRHDQARKLYDRALMLYQVEQEPTGTSYTFAELARCFHDLRDDRQRDVALVQALRSAELAHNDGVTKYVMAALIEVTGGREAAALWLKRQGSGN